MATSNFPEIGAQTRRKSDGVLGEICASNPPRRLVTVRWPTFPGAWARKVLTAEQFAHTWELTGVRLPPERETGVAITLIALLVCGFLAAVLIHAGHGYLGYDPYKPITADTPATLNSAQALHARYGLLAALKCGDGVDEYLRSIAGRNYNWEQASMLETRFDRFAPAVASPGVLTMISTRARVSNGLGASHPIEIDCNYDTQSHEVLSYTTGPIHP